MMAAQIQLPPTQSARYTFASSLISLQGRTTRMPRSRREFLSAAAGFTIAQAFLPRTTFTQQQKKPTRIVLLGTRGGPSVAPASPNNASTLILINDVPYVVDCGYGTSKQLLKAGVALYRVRYILVTHNHSDHN